MQVTIKKTYKIKKINLYIVTYFGLFLLHYYTDFNFEITFSLWILFGMFGYIVLYEDVKKHRNLMIILLGVDVVAFINIIINHNHSPFNAFILPVSQMFGLYLYEQKKNLKSLVNFIYLVMIYMLIYELVVPKTLANEWLGDWYTYFSAHMGGNTISIFLLLFLIIDIIYRKENNMSINYIAIFASLFMAYYGGGTGGVLTITLLFLGLFGMKWKKDKLSFPKILFLIFCGISVISILGVWNRLITVLTDSNSRFWIWEHYFECATNSLKEFIVGGDVSQIAFLDMQRNMHNTFVNWHYYYGLIPLLFFIISVIITMWRSFKYKEYTVFIFLCIVFIRAFLDETTFCFMPIWTYAMLNMNDIKLARRGDRY